MITSCSICRVGFISVQGNRGVRLDAARSTVGRFGGSLCQGNLTKAIEDASENQLKFDCEKTLKVKLKGFPNLSKSIHNSSKLDAKTDIEKEIETYLKKHVFLMCKNMKHIIQILFFQGFADCVRKRKRYQTTIKHDTNIHFKID